MPMGPGFLSGPLVKRSSGSKPERSSASMEGCKVLFQHEHGDCTRCVQRSAPHTSVCASSHTHVATDLLHSVCVCRRSTTSCRMTTTCALVSSRLLAHRSLFRVVHPRLSQARAPSVQPVGGRYVYWMVTPPSPAAALRRRRPRSARRTCACNARATAPSSGGGVVGAGAADGVAGRMAGGAGRRAPAAEAEVFAEPRKLLLLPCHPHTLPPAHSAACCATRTHCHPHALPPARCVVTQLRNVCCPYSLPPALSAARLHCRLHAALSFRVTRTLCRPHALPHRCAATAPRRTTARPRRTTEPLAATP